MLLVQPKQRESSFNSDSRGRGDTFPPSAREERELLANVPGRRGLPSLLCQRFPFQMKFQMKSEAAEPPFLRTTWSWWTVFRTGTFLFAPSASLSTPTLRLGVFVLLWIRIKAAASMVKYPACPVGWGLK